MLAEASSAPPPGVLRESHLGRERHRSAAILPQWDSLVPPSRMTETRWWLPVLGDRLSVSPQALLARSEELTVPFFSSDIVAGNQPSCIVSLQYRLLLDRARGEAHLTLQIVLSLVSLLREELPLTRFLWRPFWHDAVTGALLS